MNVTGPAPIPHVQRNDDPAILVRANQRFSAEILQVAGDRVTLSMDGVRIVARMVSADQAAALNDKHVAQFLVKDANASTVLLQLVHGDAAQAAAAVLPEPELIPNLLRNAGLPVDAATTMIARSLLTNGLQVTPELVLELQTALEQLDRLNPSDIQAAAALKSLGLPISAETLALVQGSLPPLSELLGGLRDQLKTLLRSRNATPEVLENVRKVLAFLDGLVLPLEDTGPPLAEKLKQLMGRMGQPIEKELARLQKGQAGMLQAMSGENGLLSLALLRRQLDGNIPQALTEKLDQLLDALRLTQFLNAPPETPPSRGQWLRLDLPLAPGNSMPDDPSKFQTAKLRVAYEGEGDQARLDPANTRFILRLELEDGRFAGETIQVDVSVAGKRIGAVVTASSDLLRQRAEEEMPVLQTSLEGLGYLVQVARCDACDPAHTPAVDSPGAWTSFSEVSVEA